MKRKLFILTEFFYPAINGGGPVSSINNLTKLLENKFDIKIICQNKDYNSDNTLVNIKSDTWIKWSSNVEIMYCSKINFSSKFISNTIKNNEIDALYINSIYITPFIFRTIDQAKKLNAKIVIAPRGMLQQEALNQKYLKKRLYFSFLKTSKILKNITWHATNSNEIDDIKTMFPNSVVNNISNIASAVQTGFKQVESDSLKIVSISLNTRMKNLNFIFKLLRNIKRDVIFDVFGPIKDSVYWSYCLESISKLPLNIKVNYRGSLLANDVNNTISNYHLYISPTLGENFGHSIFESFANGVPVLISKNTPWKNLEKKGVGFDLDLDENIWTNTIENIELNKLISMRQKSIEFAKHYVESQNYLEDYLALFSK